MTTLAGRSRLAPARTVDPAAFAATIDLLQKRAGLVFPATRHANVETAMQRVMRDAGVTDPAVLVALLAEDGAIFDDLVAEVTIGESYFFRESAQFDLIRTRIIPELLAARPGRRLRVWSAACSTGEEPYSLAITLLEQQVDGEILGTDISRPRLGAARHGAYRAWSLRGVAESTIDRWFKRDNDQFIVSTRAREQTTFRYLNLAEDCYPAISTGVWGMDLILCRNVLIYFDPPTIERVMRKLLDSLGDDGWLLLGAADPLMTSAGGAEVIETPAGLAYRRSRPGSTRTTLPFPAHTVPDEWARTPRPAPYDVPDDAAVPEASPAVRGTGPAIPPASADGDQDPIAGAYARRDYPTVVTLVEAVESSRVASTEHWILMVRALANLGRLPEAGRACAAALDARRDVPELHYLHSVLLMESGRPADAAAAARRALYLDRGMIVAHLAVATAASRSGDSAAATRALAAAERLLATLPAAAIVPASDGEAAGRLLEMTRVQRRLVSGTAS